MQAYLAGLPSQTARLNLLHGFFGVGALLGPLAATWVLDRAAWTVVWLLLGLLAVPVAVAYAATFPGPSTPGRGDPAAAGDDAPAAGEAVP